VVLYLTFDVLPQTQPPPHENLKAGGKLFNLNSRKNRPAPRGYSIHEPVTLFLLWD